MAMRVYVATNGTLVMLGSPDPGAIGEALSREESVEMARKILAWSSDPTAPSAPPAEPAPPSPLRR